MQEQIGMTTRETLDEGLVFKATQILTALSDSTRFKLLLALSKKELCVQDIVKTSSVTQSAISHQLRLLRDRQLVKVRREGKKSLYSLADEHVAILIEQALAHARHIEMESDHDRSI